MLRCPALSIQLILEEVNEQGEIVGERATPPQKLFAKFWPDIPRLVAHAIDAANQPQTDAQVADQPAEPQA